MKPPLDLGPIKDRMVRATCVQDMNSVTLAALDIPALVAEVESMRAENERMRRVVEAAKAFINGTALHPTMDIYNALAALSPTAGKETA